MRVNPVPDLVTRADERLVRDRKALWKESGIGGKEREMVEEQARGENERERKEREKREIERERENRSTKMKNWSEHMCTDGKEDTAVHGAAVST